MNSQSYRFQLLAPAKTSLPSALKYAIKDADKYRHYLSSLQRLRAQTYFEDGAITQRDIDPFGRFPMHQDDDCWHFLLIDTSDEVVGCVRYLLHSPAATFEDLWVSRAPVARDPLWGPTLRRAVESDLLWLCERKLCFAEVGGWTIHPDYRHTRAALEVVLGSFAWSFLVSAGIGCATATIRNNSSGILRRIGGVSYEAGGCGVPAYHDDAYGCSMEILRFHFRSFDPRYRRIVQDIRLRLESQSTIQSVGHSKDEVEVLSSMTESLYALSDRLNSTESETSLSAPESSLVSA
jgi:hypothetical protein